jgi:predicted transposase YdaD
LGRELISVYNTIVANYKELQEIENGPYFTQRLTEAQLAKARAEAEAKGEAKGEIKGRAEGKAEGISRLAELIRAGYSLDTALIMIEEGRV